MISRIPMSRATVPGERIHSDITGRIRPSRSGSLYMAIFIDEATRWKSTYAMQSKNDVRAAWRQYKARFETFTERKIKCLHINNGTEYLQKEFIADLKIAGVQLKTTQFYSPEMNGIAERGLGVVCTHASAMLCAAQLPIEFWPEATSSATFVSNRSPTKCLKVTSFEAWYGRPPCLGFLRVFGCRAYARVPHEKRRKFDDAAFECLHMGYYESENLYQVWDVENKKMVKVRDVKFHEDVLGHPSVSREALPKNTDLWGNKMQLVENEPVESEDEDIHEHDEVDIVPVVPAAEPNVVPPVAPAVEIAAFSHVIPTNAVDSTHVNTKGQRILSRGKFNEWGRLFGEVCVEEIVDAGEFNGVLRFLSPHTFIVSANDTTNVDTEAHIASVLKQFGIESMPELSTAVPGHPLPKSAKEALGGENKFHWLWAMATEIRGLLSQHTYSLVEPPNAASSNIIPAKWVFLVKSNIDGTIKRFKARWVARGDLQKYGIDYKETFAPVAKSASIRCLLIWAAFQDLEIDQVDVVTAFLYPEIEREVLIQQPLAFRLPDDKRVCRLNKALYGLCQSARCSYQNLDASLQKITFKRLSSDYALWTNGKVWIVAHVDDLLIIGHRSEVDKTKQFLATQYSITDMGAASLFLGLRITRERRSRSLWLDQKHYVLDFLKTVGLSTANAVKFPFTDKHKLDEDNEVLDESEKLKYQQMVGFLMFLMISTRPDISFHITRLAQRSSKPTAAHFALAKRVCRYVLGTADARLCLGDQQHKNQMGDNLIQGFFDAAHQDHSDFRTTFGYVFLYRGAPISWKTRKHSLVTVSTTESEYVAGAEAVREALWLHQLVNELGTDTVPFPIPLFNDNSGAIQLSKNPEYHDRTKHIGVRRCLLTEHAELGHIIVTYIQTNDLIADTLTKPLSNDKFYEHAEGMGLIYGETACGKCPTKERAFTARQLSKHTRARH